MLKKINNMKVRKKLIFCFVLVVCVASISGIMGAILMLNMDSKYSTALINNGFSQGEIGTFNTYLNKGGAIVRDIVMMTDEQDLENSKAELATAQERANEALAALRPYCTSDKEEEYLAVIDEKLDGYRVKRDQVIELGLANKNDEAFAIFRNEARPLLNDAMVAAQSLAELNTSMGSKLSSSLSEQSLITVLLIAAVIMVAVIISICFALYIAKNFERPIVQIKNASAKLAAGNLDIEVEAMSLDEIGEMTLSFKEAIEMLKTYISELSRGLGEIAKGNFDIAPGVAFKGDFKALDDAISTIVVSLSDTLSQINEASEQVALGSNQMAESAQSLAEGATDQAGAIEELTATIESVSGQVQINAENAGEAYKDAKAFEEKAEQSSEEMAQLTVAMEQLSNTSKQIENIIEEIEDIASQTNLLSLNASIEAARAGEAGKGFAVVADQIGKLASESAASAVNTRNLIGNAIQEIEKGNEITNKTTGTINQVIEGIKQLAQSSSKISTMSNTQSESMKQIEQGIEQISNVVQSNSAAAEETSATSEELSAQSEGLKQLVDQFILRKKGR